MFHLTIVKKNGEPKSNVQIAFEHGLLVGGVLAVIQIALYLLSGVVPVNFGTTIIIWLTAYAVAGYLASRKTGKLSTGMLAGFFVALLAGLVVTVYVMVVVGLNIDIERQNMQELANKQKNAPVITNQMVITNLLSWYALLITLGSLLGIGTGALSGLFGKRSNAQLEPPVENESSLVDEPEGVEPSSFEKSGPLTDEPEEEDTLRDSEKELKPKEVL